MRRIFLIAILCLITTSAFAQDSLNISRVWQSEPYIYGSSIALDGDLLYVGGPNHIRVFDVSTFESPEILSRLSLGGTIRDIEVTSDRIYAVGDSFWVIDKSDPIQLTLESSANRYARRISIDEDRGVAFTVLMNSLRAYDITGDHPPLLLDELPLPFNPEMDVAFKANFVYVTIDNGLSIINATDPTQLVQIDTVRTQGTTEPSCVSIIDDTLFVLVPSQLYLFETSDPQSPTLVGWGDITLDAYPNRLAKEDSIIVLAGADNRYGFGSIGNPQIPTYLESLRPGNKPLNVVTRGRQALFSVFADDFHLVDFSNPAEPVLTDTITFSQPSDAHEIVGDVLISLYRWNSAIWTADISDIENPVEISRINDDASYASSAISGDRMVVLRDSIGGFRLYDVSNPSVPELLTTVSISNGGPYYRGQIAMSGDYVYFAEDSLILYDVSDPLNPVQLPFSLENWYGSIFVFENKLYFSSRGITSIYDITDPTSINLLGDFDFTASLLHVEGDIAYAANYVTVTNFNVSDPASVTEISSIVLPEEVHALDAEGEFLAAACGNDGVVVISYADPLNPTVVGSYDTDGFARDVTIRDNYLYVSDGSSFDIFDISAALPVRDDTRAEIPTKVSLSAFPNPFNPSTTIAFDLNSRAQVSLDVYDVTGRFVRTLINEQLNAGSYTQNFDAQGLPSGAYFARLVTPQVSQTARITLIR